MRILTKIFLFLALAAASAPSSAQINLGIRVGPPKARIEVRTPTPVAGSVWIPGYYVYNGGRSDYDWTPGRWQVPPAPKQVWIAPRYRRNGNHYDYYEGSWKQQGKHDNGKHKGWNKNKHKD
jgi:hypothetical protein